MENYLDRKCPICLEMDESCDRSICSSPTAESLRYKKLIPFWNGFFQDKVFFSYVTCRKCELLYAPCFFSEKQLGELYEQMPPNMEVVPEQTLRRTQDGYFKLLSSVSDLKGEFLEIGPDVGLFVDACASKSRDIVKYWLIEPNTDVQDRLRSATGGVESQIITDMSDFSAIPDGSISILVMVHVLDHLLQPLETMTMLRKKLKADARALIVTHDESSLLSRLLSAKWPAYCLQHPQLFNPRSMKKILANSGFELLKLKKSVNHFPLAFLLKHLLWAIGIKVKSVPNFWDLTLGLKLGNMVTIAKLKEGQS